MNPDLPTGMNFSKEDADDFVDRVEEVNRQIRDLIDGKVDIHEIDRKEQEMKEKDRLKKLAQEIKQREQEEALKKGRPGKGHQGGYITFCKGCFREYTIAGVDVCAICGKDTMT
jgi:myosin-crossreactive antigen